MHIYFARNWQLPFLNLRKGENDRRKYFLWSISTKECCRPRRGLNPLPAGLQSDGAYNWAIRSICITKTCLYNFDPFKPHFYIEKLGLTGVYIIFLISAQKQRLWVLTSTHNLCFWAEIWKISDFVVWKFSFFGGKIFSIFEYACFCNGIFVPRKFFR